MNAKWEGALEWGCGGGGCVLQTRIMMGFYCAITSLPYYLTTPSPIKELHSYTSTLLTSTPSSPPVPPSDNSTNHPPFIFQTDCGTSLYTLLDVMPDAVCIKSGSVDDKAVRDYKPGVEFYVKDRMGYASEVEGAKQERVFG